MAIVKKRRRKNTKLVDWIKQQDQEPKQQQYISIDVLSVYDGLWNIFHMKTFSMQFIIDVCVYIQLCVYAWKFRLDWIQMLFCIHTRDIDIIWGKFSISLVSMLLNLHALYLKRPMTLFLFSIHDHRHRCCCFCNLTIMNIHEINFYIFK